MTKLEDKQKREEKLKLDRRYKHRETGGVYVKQPEAPNNSNKTDRTGRPLRPEYPRD